MSNRRRVQKALDENAKQRAAERAEKLAKRDLAEELATCLDVLAEAVDKDDSPEEFETALWQTVELTLALMSEHQRLLVMLGQYQDLLVALDQAAQQPVTGRTEAGIVLPDGVSV